MLGLNQRPRRQTFCLDPQYIRSAQQGQPWGTYPNTPRRQVFHSLIQITIDANTPNTDFIEAKRLARVQTCIDGMRVLRRHPPEGQLDDAGRIEADIQLQKQQLRTFMRLKKGSISLLRSRFLRRIFLSFPPSTSGSHSAKDWTSTRFFVTWSPEGNNRVTFCDSKGFEGKTQHINF